MNDDFKDNITTFRKKRKKPEFSRETTAEGFEAEEEYRNGHGDPKQTENGASGAREEGQSGAWTRKSSRPWEEAEPRKALPYNKSRGEPMVEEDGFKLPFDPWRLPTALKRKWFVVIGVGAIAAAAFFTLGQWGLNYSAQINLFRREALTAPTDNNGVYKPREYSDATMYGFMRAGDVIRKVAEKSQTNIILGRLKLTPQEISKSVSIKPNPNPDLVTISISSPRSIPALVELANLYAREVVAYTKEIQAGEAAEEAKSLGARLALADRALAEANEKLTKFNEGSGLISFDRDTDANVTRLANLEAKQQDVRFELETIGLKISNREKDLTVQSPGNGKLQQAKEELATMLLTLTKKHPDVISQERKIQLLEQRQKEEPASKEVIFAPNSPNATIAMQIMDLKNQQPVLVKQDRDLDKMIADLKTKLKGLSGQTFKYAMLKKEKDALEITRQSLAQKQRETQSYVENALGYFRMPSAATAESVNTRQRFLKILAFSILGGIFGLGVSALGVMIAEIADASLKTAIDVERVTKLPVLATLGDLRKMDPTAQVNWAFRTLTVLRGKLNCDANEALVCGIISSKHGEGRSTWVNLLVSAASQRGLRVLTVDTRPTSAEPAASTPNPEDPVTMALTTNVLQTPATISNQLNDPNSQPVVHIPLPGWVWNLERRKQWHNALDQWQKLENLVIFVELPPATQPESVLLAENLPQVIWLAGSGMPDAAETATQLDTLRHAGCNMVGAVLNQEPRPFFNGRITRWFTKGVAILTFGLSGLASLNAAPVQKQSEAPVDMEQRAGVRAPGEAGGTDSRSAPVSLSASNRTKRAPWQERLTLGPGDVVDIQLFGLPALTRTNIFVGPDGRLGYLQAQSVYVTGMTIEELRAKLDEELAKYYTTARSIVIPVAFNSKKYYMLGKVNNKGVYPLDRPLTIVEAVARAKGLESGLYQRNSVELADLSRSFVIRDGQRMAVNFEKLFLNGDLSQNFVLQPNDYVYFASTGANEIYVLGEVGAPGPIGFVPDATLLTVLTDRGGFTERAYKKKVLVVRGSLNQPETFVVNAGAILDAKEADFRLQPRDIVYVSARPWIKVEELLDDAASSFIQGAVTAWTGGNIGPILKRQLPSLK